MKQRRVLWSRHALDELKDTAAFIAADNPTAARRVANAIRRCGAALGEAAIGRPGRVAGTYEKSVPRLPYIIAYTVTPAAAGVEAVVILRVIHGARGWGLDAWPD